MKCLLIGNYGVENLGDEALREYFLEAFPSIEWTVLSANPSRTNEISRLPFGLRSFFGTGWLRTLGAFRRCDAVVFGGGSLFTDVESLNACYLWAWHATVAFVFRKPVLLAFQGMGPYKTKAGERLARYVAGRASFISVRDAASVSRMSDWGLSIKIVQTFDPVFSFMVKGKTKDGTKNVCTIIPRANSSDALVQAAVSLIRMRPAIHHIAVVLMQPDEPGEQAIARRLLREVGLQGTVIEARTLPELMKAVGTSAIVLTQRFHGALATVASGVEIQILPQGKGDKMHELEQLIDSGKADVPTLLASIEEGRRALAEALHV